MSLPRYEPEVAAAKFMAGEEQWALIAEVARSLGLVPNDLLPWLRSGQLRAAGRLTKDGYSDLMIRLDDFKQILPEIVDRCPVKYDS